MVTRQSMDGTAFGVAAGSRDEDRDSLSHSNPAAV